MIRKKVAVVTEVQTKPKINQGVLRLQNDVKNFNQRQNGATKQLQNVSLQFPKQGTINPIHIHIKPRNGFYKNTQLTFIYTIPDNYPYQAPIVQCKQKVFHPNIDPVNRAVCLSILKDKWQPNNELIQVIYGIWQILQCLNQGDLQKPLDSLAAQIMKDDPNKYQQILNKTLKGQSYEGRQFSNVWIN